MSENEKEKIRKKYTALAMGLLAVIAVYMIFSIVVLKKITIVYNVMIIVGLTAFWAIMDIVIPLKTQALEGKTEAQLAGYKKYVAADFLGYVGLMYFALAAQRNTGIYGAIIYLISRMLRNRFQEEFNGTQEDEDEDEPAEESEPSEGRELTEESELSEGHELTEGGAPAGEPGSGGDDVSSEVSKSMSDSE